MNKSPSVLILTLNYNQPAMTVECVTSLLGVGYDNYSILIVDNFSTDENYEKLINNLPDDSKIKVFRTKQNIGYGKGINYGLDKTKNLNPDYWLIINNDTKIDKDAISALVEVAERYQKNCIVSGKIYHYNDPQRIQYIGGKFKNNDMMKNTNLFKDEIDVGQAEQEMEMDMLDDIFWLLPIRVYHKIGGYCPYYFMYAEQSDYVLKAKKNGIKMIYTPRAKLWHKGELSSGMKKGNPVTRYWRIKSSLIYLYRYLGHKKFFYKYLYLFFKLPIKVILFKLTKQSFKNNLATYLGFIAFTKWIFVKKNDYGYNPFIKRNAK